MLWIPNPLFGIKGWSQPLSQESGFWICTNFIIVLLLLISCLKFKFHSVFQKKTDFAWLKVLKKIPSRHIWFSLTIISGYAWTTHAVVTQVAQLIDWQQIKLLKFDVLIYIFSKNISVQNFFEFEFWLIGSEITPYTPE